MIRSLRNGGSPKTSPSLGESIIVCSTCKKAITLKMKFCKWCGSKNHHFSNTTNDSNNLSNSNTPTSPPISSNSGGMSIISITSGDDNNKKVELSTSKRVSTSTSVLSPNNGNSSDILEGAPIATRAMSADALLTSSGDTNSNNNTPEGEKPGNNLSLSLCYCYYPFNLFLVFNILFLPLYLRLFPSSIQKKEIHRVI